MPITELSTNPINRVAVQLYSAEITLGKGLLVKENPLKRLHFYSIKCKMSLCEDLAESTVYNFYLRMMQKYINYQL